MCIAIQSMVISNSKLAWPICMKFCANTHIESVLIGRLKQKLEPGCIGALVYNTVFSYNKMALSMFMKFCAITQI